MKTIIEGIMLIIGIFKVVTQHRGKVMGRR